MKFHNKVSDYATMGKKGNVMYWDAIDDLCENFTRDLLAFSVPGINVGNDDILYLQNEIRDFAVKFLEKESGAKFPFIDEDF